MRETSNQLQESILSEYSYESLLKKSINPIIGCIAAKYCNNHVVGMEFEDLCQEGRLKFWDQYSYYLAEKPHVSISEVVKIFKSSFVNICLDLQRRYYFSEKRCVNKVVDLDRYFSYQDGVPGEDEPGIQKIADSRSGEFISDLETKELFGYMRTLLPPLEKKILDETVNPSEELLNIKTKEENKRFEACTKAKTKFRSRRKATNWEMALVLGTSYSEVSHGVKHMRTLLKKNLVKRRMYSPARTSRVQTKKNLLEFLKNS